MEFCGEYVQGIRMRNQSGIVILETNDEDKKEWQGNKMIELKEGERIIGIRSHDDGAGYSIHKNF